MNKRKFLAVLGLSPLVLVAKNLDFIKTYEPWPKGKYKFLVKSTGGDFRGKTILYYKILDSNKTITIEGGIKKVDIKSKSYISIENGIKYDRYFDLIDGNRRYSLRSLDVEFFIEPCSLDINGSFKLGNLRQSLSFEI